MHTHRSQEKELLDLGPDYYTHNEFIHCLKKLFLINKLLGFFRSTVKTLNHFSKTTTLLDIGCGSGLFILHLSRLFPHMQMVGMDISPTAIAYAEESLNSWQKRVPNMLVSFKLQKQKELNIPKNSFDIIVATLVCHHLTDEELICFLQQAYQSAKHIVIINDLHRHRLAYWFYQIISPVFRNRLITHDGLISIQRSFTRSDWKLLLQKAGIENYRLKWCFPFWWKLILQK